MEHYKIPKFLNNSSVSKFVTRKWIKVNDLWSDQYPADATLTTGATFQINKANLYVPVVTLSIDDDIRFKARI